MDISEIETKAKAEESKIVKIVTWIKANWKSFLIGAIVGLVAGLAIHLR